MLALVKPTRKGKLFFRATFKLLIKLVYSYYDLIFAVTLILSCGAMSCRWIEVIATKGGVDNALAGSFDFDVVDSFGAGIKVKYEPKHVNFLHDNMLCLNIYDIQLKFLGIVLIFSSLVLRYYFSKLRRFSKNPHCYDSCLDSTDVIQEVVVNLVLAISHVLSVVLPSNKTSKEKQDIVDAYNKKDTAQT
jgi:hypothetical protein